MEVTVVLPQLPLVEKIVSSREFLDKVVDMPAVVNDRCLWSRKCIKTVEISVHRDFTVAVHLGGSRCPCCAGRARSTVASRGGESRDPTAAGRREYRVSSLYGGGGGEGGFSHSVHLDVECPPCRDFFEPSMANSCWSSRAPVL